MRLRPCVLVLVGCLTSPAVAQQATIPVRPLGPILRTSVEPLSGVSGVRVLSDGRVLVNDATAHRVVLFDSTLAHVTVVADTTSDTKKAYGAAGGGILRFTGDSSLFIDRVSMSMLVIDPNGAITRIMAVPGTTAIASNLTVTAYGAEYDGAGHFLYRALPRSVDNGPPLQPGDNRLVWYDSAPIVRVDLATRQVDTVAKLKTFSEVYRFRTETSSGSMSVRSPLSPSDDWALLADGTLAIVRVGEYRIDWIGPDGAHSVSPKIQHDWAHISDSVKRALIDSLKRADSTDRAKQDAAMARRDSIVKAGGADPDPPRTITSIGPNGQVMTGRIGTPLGAVRQGPPPMFIDPNDMPDYWPPFNGSPGIGGGSMAVKADADGNLWIRIYQRTPIAGGPIYDIVNRQGVLVDRIQIPGSTTIVGFGPGVVYLTSREGNGTKLARARVH